MRPITRLDPVGPVHAYKSYEILAPLSTHYRAASCAEVDCQMQANGWILPVDESTEIGQRQAHYIRRISGRVFIEESGEVMTLFSFPPGQECFADHQIRLDREETYIVRGGDWRGNPMGERLIYSGPDAWVDDFATHQDRLAMRINRG